MSFQNPDYLNWLFLIPFIALIYILQVRIRKRKIQKWLGEHGAFLRSSISDTSRYIKIALGLCAAILLLIALARPQGKIENTKTQTKGIYMLLLVDISNSMLAEDVKPNRLTFMKQEILRLIDLSLGDQIALGIFANSSVLAIPFTHDLLAVKSYLNELSVNYLSHQGTNFKRAFELSHQVFEKVKENNIKDFIKVVVVASDGEDHSTKTKKVIQKLIQEKGIRVFTLSFGTEEGGVIPIKDHKGKIKEYKKDMSGNLVITRLKNKSLKNFAKWGKGGYYHVTYSSQSIEKLRKNLDQLEKNLLKETSWIKKRENYQWFLAFAFLIALIELILTDRSFMKRDKI